MVGIGASAGGLEALQRFFKALPSRTGMAFVIVQHMDPKGSMLPEILQRSAEIPVIHAVDGLQVEPDKAYVIPPNTTLRIAGGALRVECAPEGRTPHMSVDAFFRSLAEDRKNAAIGVILSGTGLDGSEGIRAIKAGGGIVFAQDEASAKYPGMPKSALQTGCVDVILSPDEIGREVGRIARHSLAAIAGRASGEREESQESAVAKIFALLRRDTGVDFSGYKQAMLARRIYRRMVVRKMAKIEDYIELLKERPEERASLFQDFMINVTSFFREPEAFEALKTEVIPRLVRERAEPGSPVRIWVPGCSSGEEAYSLAIGFLEVAAELATSVSLQVFATDINEFALDAARTGIYPENIRHDVSPARLQRFFDRTERGFQINKQIRTMCIFARQNVAQDPPFSRLDLVSCRNVLIYMKAASQKWIIPCFHYALNPGGILFLGESESVGEHGGLFERIDRKNKIYRKKISVARPVLDFGTRIAHADADGRGKVREPVWTVERLDAEANKIVLGRYAPPGVVINDQMEIVQFRGATETYLAPPAGPASFDLLRMARGGLGGEIRRATVRAKRERKSVRREGLHLTSGNRKRAFAVEVIPLPGPSAETRNFLVLFDEASSSPAQPPRRKGSGGDGPPGTEEYVRNLEQELQETREYLESVVAEYRMSNEELRSANEEIQSSNEELQSTNEELETAKEELQSTNEELTTLNEELENRNVELVSINNDLNNFIANTQIPLVMVDSKLRIRRFTPRSEQMLNLIASDVGRPIGDVNLNMHVEGLEEKLRRVDRTFEPIAEHVQDRQGRRYEMMVRPYRTADQRIDGAVLSFTEVDLTNRESEVRTNAFRFGTEAIAISRDPQVLLDGDCRIVSGNRSFYDFFRLDPRRGAHRPIFELGKGAWCPPAIRTLLEKRVREEQVCENIVVEHDFPSIGRKTLLVDARRIDGFGALPDAIVLAFHEVESDR